ncbi:type I restriction enzyme, S subunit [Burkholderia multivorans]
MSHYKPYPAYKDSGVEWLEKVPEHWEVKPLKYEADFVNGAAFKPEQWAETGTPIIRIENLNGSLSFNCFEGEMDFRYHVEKGDLLFGWSGNRGTSFGPFIWPHEGQYYLNQHIFRICNFKFDKRWFYWSLKAVTAHVEDQAHGIIGMVHITKGDLGSIKIATPALAEQQAIAVHLDRETTRIDALVEKKTRFIELLREKRQALITHAVTKGLDPNAPMKDSGVEWLGDVPEHWDVSSIKSWFRTSSGGTPDTSRQEEFYTEAGGHPWIRTTDLNNGELWDCEIRITDSAMAASACSILPINTVLVAMYGGEGTIGKFSIARFPSAINQALCALLPSKHFSSDFVYWYVQYYRPYWMVWAESTRKDPNISQELIRNAPIVRPPIAEQLKICAVLAAETSRVDTLIEKTERSIELLKERRAALITAAVTGQIDLQEAA